MQRESCDVFMIGGGNAGFGVTVPTRKAGMKVIMAEARDLGGTCPNRGLHAEEGAGRRGLCPARDRASAHVHCISVGKPISIGRR